mmetsp:Transcript_30712/g.52532  ORF Transcript_30712/g.52532 Transcript_30712/m.52532 type:complete len:204 (-) Transcript_30712:895-1506(-)
MSSWLLKRPVFGMCPMATKAASAGTSVTLDASVVDSTTTVVRTPPSEPLNSLTVEFHITVIFGLESTALCSTADARKVSRRWMSVTDDDVRARTSASSIAVSPPPITTTGFAEKRKPSHVAHDETPPPLKSSSPGTESQRLSAPVAITIACAVSAELFVLITKGRCDRSTSSTSSSSKVVANLRACRFMSLMMSPPLASKMPG